MTAEDPGLYLVRNVHTPFWPSGLGREHVPPSERGVEEAKRAADYLQHLGLRAVVACCSPFTARSQATMQLVLGNLSQITVESASLEDITELGRDLPSASIADKEARAIRTAVYYRDVYQPPPILPGRNRPPLLLFASGPGIDKYLNLGLAWDDPEASPPGQEMLLPGGLPDGESLLPTGSVLIPYTDKLGRFQLRGLGVDALSAHIKERSDNERQRQS